MLLQIAQYTKFCSEFGIVSEIINMSSCSIVFLCTVLWLPCRGCPSQVYKEDFWHKSVDQSSLEDQDKQQISFFVTPFTVKYSDRLVATAALKVLDFLNVLGSVRGSVRFCIKIAVQFETLESLSTIRSCQHERQRSRARLDRGLRFWREIGRLSS